MMIVAITYLLIGLIRLAYIVLVEPDFYQELIEIRWKNAVLNLWSRQAFVAIVLVTIVIAWPVTFLPSKDSGDGGK